jgi:hypothetical protein
MGRNIALAILTPEATLPTARELMNNNVCLSLPGFTSI